ncbi:MAG: phage major capsid protein [Desulfobacterales bacterium]|nr:phage major capsid protein [Desulfobacterales bacterium]
MEELLRQIRELMNRMDELRAKDKLSKEEAEERKGLLPKIKALNEEIRQRKEEDELLDKMNESLEEPPSGDDPETRNKPKVEVAPGTTRENPYGGDFGHFLHDVRQAADGPRSKKLEAIRSASGQSESTGSDGGFLVEPQVVLRLTDNITQEGTIAGMCNNQPIGANFNGLKTLEADDKNSKAQVYRNGGMVAYFAAEAASVDISKLKFKQREHSLQKIIAFGMCTEELLQDTVALGAQMEKGAEKAINFVLEDKIFSGKGAGVPIGILTSNAAVKVTREKANSVTYSDVTMMSSRLYVPSFRNAVWFYNQEVMPALQSIYIKTGENSGYPAFMPPSGLSEIPYGVLMGRPAMPIEYCEGLGTEGDLVLVDMSEYELITKGKVKPSTSIHVKFMEDETAFKFIYRINGQPKWSSPKAPHKGTKTVSPFVVLK